MKGTYLMAKHFAKALDGKTGTFINMSSAAGVFASPGQAAYCSNKAAGIRIIEELHLGMSSPHCLTLSRIPHPRPPLPLQDRRPPH